MWLKFFFNDLLLIFLIVNRNWFTNKIKIWQIRFLNKAWRALVNFGFFFIMIFLFLKKLFKRKKK